MAVVELALTLELGRGVCEPQVRAWIDVRPELGLESENELPLVRRNPLQWIGFFTVASGPQTYFLYRIGVAAHPGAIWSLLVRRRDRAYVLLRDADSLALPKLWLAGTCPMSA
jgi:hypothetical protein